jgi:hypothetical protein
MNERHLYALSRFFDGESVDPPLLLESLADPEAATYLTEWAALRAAVREDDSRPSDRFYASMAAVLTPTPVRRASWGRWIGPAVAASVLLAAGSTGFEAGRLFQRQHTQTAGPIRAVERAAQTHAPGAEQATRRLTPPGPTAVPAVTPPQPQPPTRRPEDWPVADSRLRFESWREAQRGGQEDRHERP